MAELIFKLFSEGMNVATTDKPYRGSQDESRWYGAGELVEPENNILKEAFDELNRACDKSKLNPELEPTSARAYNEAKTWILWVTNKFGLTNPYIVVPGDGGIIVEWYNDEDFVSVNFDEKNEKMDGIFYRIDNKKDTENFNEENLEELITNLIYKEEITSPFRILQASSGSSASNRNIRTTFARAGSASYASG